MMSSERYKHGSQSTCNLPNIGVPFDSLVEDCYMQTISRSNPRKRQYPDWHPPQLEGVYEPVLKKHKVVSRQSNEQPSAFWDNLSEIPLTKRALRELDRRNARSALISSTHQRTHRRLTRRTIADWERYNLPFEPITSFLVNCGNNSLNGIKYFSRHGGPNLSDIRGFRRPISRVHDTMQSSQTSSLNRSRSRHSAGTKSTTDTARTKSTGPYDRAFQQDLVNHHIYPHGYRYPDGRVPPKPRNWQEINRRLARPRPSLSPSKFFDEDHEKFVQADADAFKEKQVTTSVIPIIEGEIKDARCVSGGIPFTNLAPLTDDNVVPGNPDIYYGARPEQLDRRVRNEHFQNNLSDHIVSSTQHDLPILPNFVLAAKGPDGSLAVAGRQACYDGALGARAMHALQSYGEQDPFYDGNTYTITSIYHSGTLKIFTSHLTKPASPDDRPKYIISQIKGYSLTGDPETFRHGATAYKNLRDWAKEQRDNAIKQANDKVIRTLAGPSNSNTSDTSPVSSFATQVSEEETYTNETQEETLHSFVQEDVGITDTLQVVGNLEDEIESNPSQSLKHPISSPRRATSQRKRQNGPPEEAGISRVSSLAPTRGASSNDTSKSKTVRKHKS